MKMTKIAFWKMYLLFNDANRFCNRLSCKNQCPYYKNCDDIVLDKLNAEAYIKRHEGKSRKKADEPKAKSTIESYKCIRVDPVYVMCINNRNTHTPLTIGKKYEVVGEGKGHYTIQDDIGTLCCMQKDRFDDGKEKASEPVGNTDKLVEPVIEPIKFDDPVPEYVYVVDSSVIRCYVIIGGFKKVVDKAKDGSVCDKFSIYARLVKENSGIWLNGDECYKTLDEAVIVAKSKWSIK